MTSIKTPAKALEMVRSRKTADLIQDIILTGKMIDSQRKSVNPDMFTVRGWLLDEIERRDPEGYEAWIDSDLNDDKLPKFIHC